MPPEAIPTRLVIVGCGALARELLALTAGIPGVRVEGVDARLHMRPERITDARRGQDREGPRALRPRRRRIFVGYADCGTAGVLDAYLEREGIDRIAGEHCFEFYAGAAAYAASQDEEVGTFYLTDFLARQFESIILAGLGLDRHPELLPLYFGNYRRLVYLAQTDDSALTERARAAADHLGLTFERRLTGYGDLASSIHARRHRRSRLTCRHSRSSGGATSPRRSSPRTAGGRARSSCTRVSRSPSTRPRIGPGCASTTATSANGARPIDRAATTSRPIVKAESERLEEEYTKHHLAELIQTGGIAGGQVLAPATTSEIAPS